MEQYREAGEWPPLPDCPAQYLYDHLMDAGPIVGTPMGPMAIGWNDLLAWEAKTGFKTRPWEARLLRSLSASYLAENRAAEDPLRPMPWLEMQAIIDRRDEIGRKVSSLFKGLVVEQPKRNTGRARKRAKAK